MFVSETSGREVLEEELLLLAVALGVLLAVLEALLGVSEVVGALKAVLKVLLLLEVLSPVGVLARSAAITSASMSSKSSSV
jgi:hypothetical protein